MPQVPSWSGGASRWPPWRALWTASARAVPLLCCALLPGRATRELARLLPEIGAAPEGSGSGTARARLFEEMLVVLDQLGNRSPVVLIIEDAHWADRSSRDLLTFLIGNQRTLGSSRPPGMAC